MNNEDNKNMKNNYEYDFIRVRLKGGFFTGKISLEYQQTIKERSILGWRFVQCFAPAVAGYGSSVYVDLIFERPISN